MQKITIRFYNDREVRAIWDEAASKWWFSVLDIVAAINREPDYDKMRNYWKWLKGKLKRESSQLVSATTQLKLVAPDGATRIWLDLMLKRSLKKCIDWSKVDKRTYLDAMRTSVADSSALKALLLPALTDKINDREMFMKGIDCSYYYEEAE